MNIKVWSKIGDSHIITNLDLKSVISSYYACTKMIQSIKRYNRDNNNELGFLLWDYDHDRSEILSNIKLEIGE